MTERFLKIVALISWAVCIALFLKGEITNGFLCLILGLQLHISTELSEISKAVRLRK